MECDHLIYLNNRLVSNFDLEETNLVWFVEYQKYCCNYCGHTKIIRENFFVTIIGFLPRIPYFIINLLKNIKIFNKKDDF